MLTDSTSEGIEFIQHLENNQLKTNNPVFDFGKEAIQKHFNELPSIANEASRITDNIFPIEVFPEPFKGYVIGCKDALNFPIDFMATAVIAVISATIGKSAKLEVKKEWIESPVVFTAIIGNPGASKTPPIKNAAKPLEINDDKLIADFAAEYAKFKAFSELPSKERANEFEVPEPILSKTILNNCTPEILLKRLAENNRGCLFVADELATLLEGMNNYSKSDQTSNFLSMFSGTRVSVDRIKNPIPLVVKNPFLSIIGGAQPAILKRLFPPGKTDNGFLQRFLFAYPANTEKQPINDIEIDGSLTIKYTTWINEYISSTPISNNEDPGEPLYKLYKWSPQAKNLFYDWQAEMTYSLNGHNNAGEINMATILSKYDIHFPRLALILQIMDDYETEEISLMAAQGAAKLCAYFLHNAYKVLDILEKPATPEEALPEDKLRFYHALPNEFTTGQANKIGESFLPQLNIKAVQRFIDNDRFVKISHGHFRKSNIS